MSIRASTGLLHEPEANTAAEVTLAANAGGGWTIYGVQASYSATPTGGGLVIKVGSTNYFSVSIAAAGLTNLKFEEPLNFPGNTAVVVSLAAGSGTVLGKVNVQAKLE